MKLQEAVLMLVSVSAVKETTALDHRLIVSVTQSAMRLGIAVMTLISLAPVGALFLSTSVCNISFLHILMLLGYTDGTG